MRGSTVFISNLKTKIRKRLVRLFDFTCIHWKRHVTITSKFITQFVYRNLMYYIARIWTILNYNKRTSFDFLISLTFLYWKWLVIITSKSIMHFSKKTVCFIWRHSSKRAMILLSRCYIAKGGTTMNYAKIVVIIITMHILS